ncbi:unnamed protein product [Coffea canephora]|uniref:Uncharacterized protein n=1 Tax=Coffea canephora TaxID=49390 RepID=A0A068V112_COFCA|nr:unnamed protein product [Coffea canephora]
MDRLDDASNLLLEIAELSTPFGSSVERVAAYFADALSARIMHHCLYDITGSDFATLRLLTLLRPKLITIVEQGLSHEGSFLGRFVEALHYYSMLFDALGDGLATDSGEKHMVEQQLLGC